jgi:hypothetical protein
MKKLLVIILLGCTGFAFGQTGVRVNLNDLLSVTFPVNPTKTKTDSNATVYSANQNGAFYIVTVTNMSMRSDLSANSDSLQHFYDGLLNSTVKKLNAKLDYKESGTISDVKDIEFGYTLVSKAGFPDTRFERSVYLNKTLISFSFWTFKDKLQANTADRDIFFRSIVSPSEPAPPTPYQGEVKTAAPADTAKTPAQQAATKATVSRVGYSVGYILGAVILTALIIGLLIMIKKTFYNKKI